MFAAFSTNYRLTFSGVVFSTIPLAGGKGM